MLRRSRPKAARRGVIALVAILAAAPTDAASTTASPQPSVHPTSAHVVGPAWPPALAEAPPPPAPSWAARLPAIAVKNRNTSAEASILLYDTADGSLDPAALRAFMRVACSKPEVADSDVVEPLDPRLVQLAFRAAYHFGSTSMLIVSATRQGDHGKHGKGDALDFRLAGVLASSLAAYARGFPRAGVGLYDHPETQYVHVDVRSRSWHWADSSPPGVTWPERVVSDPTQLVRDASYIPAMDLPEAAAVP